MEAWIQLQSQYGPLKFLSGNSCCCLIETNDNELILLTDHIHNEISVNGIIIFSKTEKLKIDEHDASYRNKTSINFSASCTNRNLQVSCVLNGGEFIFNGDQMSLEENKQAESQISGDLFSDNFWIICICLAGLVIACDFIYMMFEKQKYM